MIHDQRWWRDIQKDKRKEFLNDWGPRLAERVYLLQRKHRDEILQFVRNAGLNAFHEHGRRALENALKVQIPPAYGPSDETIHVFRNGDELDIGQKCCILCGLFNQFYDETERLNPFDASTQDWQEWISDPGFWCSISLRVDRDQYDFSDSGKDKVEGFLLDVEEHFRQLEDGSNKKTPRPAKSKKSAKKGDARDGKKLGSPEPLQQEHIAALAIAGESAPQIAAVAATTELSPDEKMCRILAISTSATTWESQKWGDVLGLTSGRVRQLSTWKNLRHAERKSD